MTRHATHPSQGYHLAPALPLIIAVIITCLLFWLLYRSGVKQERSTATEAQAQKDARQLAVQHAFDAAQQLATTTDLHPITVTGIIPQAHETFYYSMQGVRQVVEKTIREYRGRSGGASLYVGHGISLRSGATRGHQVEHTSMVYADAGTLYISNKRFVFLGLKKTTAVLLTHVVSATDFVDCVKIDLANAAPLIFATDAQNVGAYVRRIMTSPPVAIT